MIKMLDRVVTNPKLVWDASTFGWYVLPREVLDEAERVLSDGDYAQIVSSLGENPHVNAPEQLHETMQEFIRGVSNRLGDFPHLRRAMEHFNQAYLREGRGFGTIRGLGATRAVEDDGESRVVDVFDKTQKEIIYWIMSRMLGDPLEQNADGDIRYEVRAEKDKEGRERTMEKGARYSKTAQGGALHTDAVQWDEPPDVLGLLCLHPAMSGGESVVVSAHATHNKFLEERLDLLKVLYQPFPFGNRRSAAVQTQAELAPNPIFTYDPEKDELRMRYIDTYFPPANSPNALSSIQRKAIEMMQSLYTDPRLVVPIGTLQAGDVNYMMNHLMLHGRGSGFINYPEPEKERVMIRAWLRDRQTAA